MGCRNNIATFSIGNNSMDKHHVQPTFLGGGGGGGVEPPKKIFKKGVGLDGISVLRDGLLGKKGVTLFRGIAVFT